MCLVPKDLPCRPSPLDFVKAVRAPLVYILSDTLRQKKQKKEIQRFPQELLFHELSTSQVLG